MFAKQVDESMKDEGEVFIILASMKDESKVVINELPKMCDFPEVFHDDINDFMPKREVEFDIDLVPGTSPVLMAPYRMNALKLSETKKKLELLLEKKMVRLSVSSWGAPVLLVKKKDGRMRLCVDYRYMN